MRLLLTVLALATVAMAQDSVEDEREKRQSGFYQPQQSPRAGPQKQQQLLARFPIQAAPQGFRAAPVAEEEQNHNAVTAQPLLLARPAPSPRPVQQLGARALPQAQGQRRPPPRPQFPQEEVLEEELEEEPDRLSLLLPQSKFDCGGKKTGYYADEGLHCEVFHYCQDNAKHSWICPEGFVFHQVHLICMPPSGENICKQSSQFHFVNEYLYRPVNAEEHQNKPNVTLRYSDRYYPDAYYEDAPAQAPAPARRPVFIQQQPQQQVYRQQANQVFHSPEEVNIPLQYRRPSTSAPQRTAFPTTTQDDEYDDFRQG